VNASEEPRNLLERACAAAFEALEETLAEEGATLQFGFISINASGQPGGEPDAATALEGEELPEDLADRARMVLATLVGHAVHVGRQIGVRVQMIPVGRIGEG
jgi:hypothetical protein